MKRAVSVDDMMKGGFLPELDKLNIWYCCVAGCAAKSSTHPFLRFHPFPKPGSSHLFVHKKSGRIVKMDRKDIWDMIFLMKKPSTVHHRVCSLHFQKTDCYLKDSSSKQTKLHNAAIPTLNLPQSSKSFQFCCVKHCANYTNKSTVEFFTIKAPTENGDSAMWYRWRKALGIYKICDALTVCAKHFIKGFPSHDPADPDYVPSINLYKNLKIVEVNVSNSFISVVEPTLEDPLKLAEPEFVAVEENVQVKEEPMEYEEVLEDCIKVEPVELNEVFIKTEPIDSYYIQDHSYCK